MNLDTQMTLRMNQSMREQIEVESEKRGLSMSQFIVACLTYVLERLDDPEKFSARIEIKGLVKDEC